jgi:hypothetical protein
MNPGPRHGKTVPVSSRKSRSPRRSLLVLRQSRLRYSCPQQHRKSGGGDVNVSSRMVIPDQGFNFGLFDRPSQTTSPVRNSTILGLGTICYPAGQKFKQAQRDRRQISSAFGGIVKTCGLACHGEVVRSVAGRERSCRSDQEPALTIRSVAGNRPVTNGCRDSRGMRRTTTALRLGILAGRSRQSCIWHPQAGSPERCSMWAAGPARTLFTSPRWDCRFWALTWLKRRWPSPERRQTPVGSTTVGSRLSSLRLMRSSWSVWGAGFRPYWTADSSTPSMKMTSEHNMQRVWRR